MQRLWKDIERSITSYWKQRGTLLCSSCKDRLSQDAESDQDSAAKRSQS